MAQRKLRTCASCSKVENTFSRVSNCAACCRAAVTASYVAREKAHLEELGYAVLEETPSYDSHGHRKWKLITPCCGNEYTALYLTVTSMIARRNILPCLSCGGQERMKKAIAGYVKKYGRIYDEAVLQSYTLKVRTLTAKNYLDNKHLINPNNYPRGTGDGFWHVDHVVPIIWGFLNGTSAELVADVSNLQMLPALENLQKGRKASEDDCQRMLETMNLALAD